MVRMEMRKRKKNSFFTAFMTLICTFLIFDIPAMPSKVFADGTAPPPSVSISTPLSGGYTNSKIVTGTSTSSTSISVWFDGNSSAAVTVTPDGSGNWSYTATSLADGNHSVSAQSTDGAGNFSSNTTSNFTLDTIRPNVSPSLYPVPDAARIPTDTQIKIQFEDASPMDQSTITGSTIQMFTIVAKTGALQNVTGSISYDPSTKTLIYSPSTALVPYSNYYVSIDPNVKDAAGNLLHPRTWSFTTDETTQSNIVSFYSNLTETQNPHGNYANNVQVCANCHEPHRGQSPMLSSPVNPTVDNYCMSCHDGTNAPIPTKWSTDPSVHKHDVQISMTGVKGASGCTSCHDPHLTWDPNTDPNSGSNTDSLRGYYKYVHLNDPTLPSTSEQKLCEACHDPSIKENASVAYIEYHYLKQNTATGTNDSTTGLPDDYSLCVRCHDGNIGTDIASFYKTTSGHTIRANDGSPMNGNMACADCHETHASPNVKELRQQLGNNNIQGTFNYTTGDWNAATERLFCLKCHNGLTELYGKTIPLNTNESGHGPNDTVSCSSCHGDNNFMEGAHAPKKLAP
jgi:predicted CXXCH cytochrome family protein